MHEIKAEEEVLVKKLKDSLVIRQKTQVLFIYGKIDKRGFQQLIAWLRKSQEHRLYCIGSQPSDMKELVDFLPMDQALSTQINVSLEKYLNDQMLGEFGWDIILKPFEILTFEYDSVHSFKSFSQRIFQAIFNISAIVSECKDFHIPKYLNTIKNIKILKHIKRLSKFKGFFKDIPALVCGAGESLALDKEAVFLARNKAVVISGGSAIRILSDLKIPFDLAAVIDPNPLYERFHKVHYFDGPWMSLFQNAPFFSYFFHGDCFMAADKENEIEKDIFKELEIEHEGYDYGWSVGNFIAFAAAYLGCNPIIMSGMDMGFSSQEYGIELEREEKNQERYDVFDEANFITRKDLYLSKQYFELLTKMFPMTTFYQSSYSRLAPEGFKKMDLLSFFKQSEDYDIKALMHQMLQSQNYETTLPSFIYNYEKKIKSELFQSLKIFEAIRRKCVSLEKRGVTHQNFKEEYFALEEHDLESLKIYSLLLLPIWPIWKHLLRTDVKDENIFLEKTFQKYMFFQRVVQDFIQHLIRGVKKEEVDG